jgi:hypothetical protein
MMGFRLGMGVAAFFQSLNPYAERLSGVDDDLLSGIAGEDFTSGRTETVFSCRPTSSVATRRFLHGFLFVP